MTYEPGNLSRTYGFLCGGNSTIYANLDGGRRSSRCIAGKPPIEHWNQGFKKERPQQQ